MFRVKLILIFVFLILFAVACFDSKPQRYVIKTSKTYEASIFRQQCAICHGPEAEGRTLDDGRIVPNLREGEQLKMKTDAAIYKQISDGGNGMTPFRGVLSERELQLMTHFVYHDLRGQ
jgi:mono/diheme cytochrome c family protein